MNWIKKNPRKFATYVGTALTGSGLFCLVPWSPWTLVIAGIIILVCVVASYMEPGDYGPP
jgi:hypothetical protein